MTMRKLRASTVLRDRAVWLVAVLAAGFCGTAVERIVSHVSRQSASVGPGGWLALFGADVMFAGLWTALIVGTEQVVRRRTDDAIAHSVGTACGVGLVAGLSLVPLGTELASGPWIAQQSFRWMVVAGVPVLGFVGVVVIVSSHLVAKARETGLIAIGVLLLVLGLVGIVADSLFLPGLYVEAHLALHAMAQLCLVLSARSIAELVLGDNVPPTIVAVLAGLILLSPMGWLSASDESRARLLAGSSIATNFLHLRAAGDAPAGSMEAALEVLRERVPAVSHDTRRARNAGYNVLLIVVDTLRSDAVWPNRDGDEEFSHAANTPFLNQWLRDAVVFERAYAQACTTTRSMPAMFRSLRPWEKPRRNGMPLGAAMAATGRETNAVVNRWFFQRRKHRVEELLDGFDHIGVYNNRRQDKAVTTAEELIVRSESPWFAWVHFYALHLPGFDGELQAGKGLSRVERYRRSLRWIDSQLRSLVAHLRDRGLLENTVVVLASDHGESLGDNGMPAHGASVYEEEIRVPLAFWVPGVEPRLVSGLACNLDVVPTLFDLIEQPRLQHRGESLLPQILGDGVGPADKWCYSTDRSGHLHAVVRGSRKLIYDGKADVLRAFDVSRDPTEDRDIFGENPSADSELLDILCAEKPVLCSSADAGADLFLDALSSDSEPPTSSLLQSWASMLIRSDGGRDAALRLFDVVKLQAAKVALVDHSFPRAPRRWSALLTEHLRSLDLASRAWFVGELARNGQQPFAVDWFAAELSRVAAGPPDDWYPWLNLLRQWSLDAEGFSPALSVMLERAPSDHVTLVALVDAIGRLQGLDADHGDFSKFLGNLLTHESPRVRRAAARAIGGVGGRSSVPQLEALVRQRTQRSSVAVQRTAIRAIARLDPGRASELVLHHGKDHRLTWAAIEIAEDIGDANSVEFLRWARKRFPNSWVRARARRALKRVAREK